MPGKSSNFSPHSHLHPCFGVGRAASLRCIAGTTMPGKFYQDDIQILYGSFQKLGDRPTYHNPYVGDPQNVLLILAKLATGRGFAQPENAEIYSESQTVVTCCKKCHFSTFRAVFSLVDFSGKMSKRFTFCDFLTFWAVFSLFDFSAKNQTVKLFAKSYSFQLFEQFWQERRKTKAVFRVRDSGVGR